MRITVSNSIQYNKYYISVQYNTHKWQELRKISVGGLLVDHIPKIFQTNIIPILWWTAMRISNEILGVQGWTLTTSPANCASKSYLHILPFQQFYQTWSHPFSLLALFQISLSFLLTGKREWNVTLKKDFSILNTHTVITCTKIITVAFKQNSTWITYLSLFPFEECF